MLHLSQSDFWTPFQTTQSGGSRYECGRETPNPGQVLLNIAFAPEAEATAIFNELHAFEDLKMKTNASQGETT